MMLHTRIIAPSAAALRSSLLVSSSSRSALAMCMRAPQQQQQMNVVFGARRMFSSSTNKNESSSEAFFKRAWTKYMLLLETRPLATKVVSGAAIAAIGDINCQVFLEPDSPFDVKRAVTFTFLGGAFISPLLHVSYGFLGRAFPGTSAVVRPLSPLALYECLPALISRSRTLLLAASYARGSECLTTLLQTVAKRLALDQLVFAPTFLSVFFSLLLTLEGEADKVPEKLAQDWWPAVKANWVVWVPAQLINFRFVPGSLQVLFSNVVGLFWNMYMSLVSHSEAHAPIEVEPTTAQTDESVSTTATAAAAAKPLLTAN